MAPVSLHIDGMHCNACVARVERAIAKVPGAAKISVRVGSATVSGAAPEALLEAVAKAGYVARLSAA